LAIVTEDHKILKEERQDEGPRASPSSSPAHWEADMKLSPMAEKEKPRKSSRPRRPRKGSEFELWGPYSGKPIRMLVRKWYSFYL
jgi:hypothetical protein